MKSSLEPGNAPQKYIPVWAVAAILDRPHRTIRNWVAAGKVPSIRDPNTGTLLVDGAAATEHHERTETRRRVSGVSVVDTVKSSKSPSVSSTRVPPHRVLSCVRGRSGGGGVAGDDPTPNQPDLTVDGGVVVPVRLDLSHAERQLEEFCNRVVRDIGHAVATGFAAACPITEARDTDR